MPFRWFCHEAALLRMASEGRFSRELVRKLERYNIEIAALGETRFEKKKGDRNLQTWEGVADWNRGPRQIQQ